MNSEEKRRAARKHIAQRARRAAEEMIAATEELNRFGGPRENDLLSLAAYAALCEARAATAKIRDLMIDLMEDAK